MYHFPRRLWRNDYDLIYDMYIKMAMFDYVMFTRVMDL